MPEYKISIVIPVYNAEKYIDATISSIVNAGLDDVELICVDDGSTDHSLQIMKKYEKDNVTIIHKENEGAPSARNEGIRHAKGEYILFFDSDDLMCEDALQTILHCIDANKADIIICEYQTISEEGKVIGRDSYKNIRYAMSKSSKLLYLYLITPFPGAKLYKKKVIDEYKIVFDDVRIGQDLNFYLKFLAHISSYHILECCVANYRIVDGSISRSFDNRILDIITSINWIEEHYTNVLENERIRFLWFASYSHLVFQYSKLKNINNLQIRSEIQHQLEGKIKMLRMKIYAHNIYELLKLLKIDRAWARNQRTVKRKFNEE